jgi:hypothetical protein
MPATYATLTIFLFSVLLTQSRKTTLKEIEFVLGNGPPFVSASHLRL